MTDERRGVNGSFGRGGIRRLGKEEDVGAGGPWHLKETWGPVKDVALRRPQGT